MGECVFERLTLRETPCSVSSKTLYFTTSFLYRSSFAVLSHSLGLDTRNMKGRLSLVSVTNTWIACTIMKFDITDSSLDISECRMTLGRGYNSRLYTTMFDVAVTVSLNKGSVNCSVLLDACFQMHS